MENETSKAQFKQRVQRRAAIQALKTESVLVCLNHKLKIKPSQPYFDMFPLPLFPDLPVRLLDAQLRRRYGLLPGDPGAGQEHQLQARLRLVLGQERLRQGGHRQPQPLPQRPLQQAQRK